jgi:hypothetical protein
MPRMFHTNTLTRSGRARWLALVTLAGGALAAAGCGGSSSPGVAHLSAANSASSASTQAGGSSPPSAASPQQALIAFARCMRSSGVPGFPDPSAGGSFNLPGRGEITLSLAFKAAQAKCQKLIPGGGPPGPGSTTNPSPHVLARMLRIAQCMRRHGVNDFPDPRTSVPSNPFGAAGYGVISDIEGVIFLFPHTIDQESPAFMQAAAACAFPLHNH